MPKPKTKATAQSPKEFLRTIEPKEKQDDGFALLKIFEQATKEKAVMWGTSILGFGEYVIKKGKQENKWPLVAFSPRKQNLTLYISMDGDARNKELWEKLGKYPLSKACVYINKLSDVDQAVLASLIKESFAHNKKALA